MTQSETIQQLGEKREKTEPLVIEHFTFERANIRHFDIANVIFKNCNFSQSYFRHCFLDNVHFENTDGAAFEFSKLMSTSFVRSTHVSFEGVYATDLLFTDAQLCANRGYFYDCRLFKTRLDMHQNQVSACAFTDCTTGTTLAQFDNAFQTSYSVYEKETDPRSVLQIDKNQFYIRNLRWLVCISPNVLRIGCEAHPVEFWRNASAKTIIAMDRHALAFWRKYGEKLLNLCDILNHKAFL